MVDDTIVERFFGPIVKHPGPDGSPIHSTGTDQSVHGDRDAAFTFASDKEIGVPSHHVEVPFREQKRFRGWWKQSFSQQEYRRTKKAMERIQQRMQRDPRWAQAEKELDQLLDAKELADSIRAEWQEHVEWTVQEAKDRWGIDIDVDKMPLVLFTDDTWTELGVSSYGVPKEDQQDLYFLLRGLYLNRGAFIPQAIEDYKDEDIIDALFFETGSPVFDPHAFPVKNTIGMDRVKGVFTKENFVEGVRHTWAMTAMDHNPWSIALQQAVAEEFDLDTSPAVDEMEVDQQSISDAEELLQRYGTALRVYAKAAYEETQEYLRQNTNRLVDGRWLPLYRGMSGVYVDVPDEGERISIKTNPLSSWSADFFVANGFASYGGVVLTDMVPVEHVWGISKLGLGAYSEREVIVLGQGAEKVGVRAPVGQR